MRKSDASAHKVAMFERCPAALQQYLAKVPAASRPSETVMAKGKVAHRAIEMAARQRRFDPTLPRVPTQEEILWRVDDAAVRAQLDPIDHVDVRQRLITGRSVLDLGEQLCDPETRHLHNLADDVVVEARYDFVTRIDGVVVIKDWKCGAGPPPDYMELKYSPQALLYLLSAKDRWPDAAGWEIHFVYVAHAIVLRVVLTADLERFGRARVLAAVRAWRAGYGAARVGAWCADCGYRLVCQAWLRALHMSEDDEEHETPLRELGDDALLKRRHEAALAAKLGERRRSDLDKEIKRRARKVGDRLRAGRLAAGVYERTTKVVAIEGVVEVAHLRGDDVVGVFSQVAKVSSKKALKLAATDAEAKAIQRWTTERTSTYVRVREVE